MSSLSGRAAVLTRWGAVVAVFAVSSCLLVTRVGSQGVTTRRVTFTAPGALSINPSLSGDGGTLAFESSADLAGSGGGLGFRLLTTDVSAPTSFKELAVSRAPAPAISQDGTRVVFASREDPLGENTDGDSEIFLSEGGRLRQLTHTTPDDPAQRAAQGCFRPSISDDDGGLVAFASDRDLVGDNPDRRREIFLLDTRTQSLTQITGSNGGTGARDAKLSGDGSRVAYVLDREAVDGVVSDLLLYTVAGGETFVAAAGVRELSLTYGRAVSDDGLRVVYSARGATGATQVFMLDGHNGHAVRQLTKLGTRSTDVPLHPTLSGDGNLIAFATRRNVTGGNSDASVELYLYDIPTDALTRLTDAPAAANAEVVSALDDRGTLVAFNFPRVLSERDVTEPFENGSEIYLATLPPRTDFDTGLQLFNAAVPERTPPTGALAPGSMAIVKGKNLALSAAEASRLAGGGFPTRLNNTSVTVGGLPAQLFFVSPTQINFQLPPGLGGTSEVSVVNHDGFETRGHLNVVRAAPGVFTMNGLGSGEALALDNFALRPGPFDVTDAAGDARRLVIFCTGLRDASNIEVLVGGRAAKFEAVVPSPDLLGLDQLHVALPSSLRGAGAASLVVRADGSESNRATLTLTSGGPPPRAGRVEVTPASAVIPVGGEARLGVRAFDTLGEEIEKPSVTFAVDNPRVASIDANGLATGVSPGVALIKVNVGDVSAEASLRVLERTLVINEVLADPPDGTAGDANHDGVRVGAEEEFVELFNGTDAALDLSGWTLRTRPLNGSNESVRHVFPQGFALPSGEALALFGGGSPSVEDPFFGGAQVATASTGSLSLTNAGLTVIVRDAALNLVTRFTYGSPDDDFGGDSINQSITRAPDVFGDFTPHTSADTARRFSPGRKADGSFFLERAGRLTRVALTPPEQEIFVGESASFTAQAFDQFERALKGAALGFESSDPVVASVESIQVNESDGSVVVRLRGLSPGVSKVTATATAGTRSVTSVAVNLQVRSRPPRITRVEVAPPTLELNRGGSAQLSADAFDENGQPFGGAVFMWRTSDSSVASIDDAGRLKASGVGTVQITAATSDNRGGEVSGHVEVHVRLPLVINELLADVPPDNPATVQVEGDANRDGVRGADDDEFVELFNVSAEPVELSGLQISDAGSVRFTFPAHTTLEAGRAVLVFGGGSPPADADEFGGALVFKTGSMSLNDTGDTVTVSLPLNGRSFVVANVTYGTTGVVAPRDQSLTRSPDAGVSDAGGDFTPHASAAGSNGRVYSPGTRADGTRFGSTPTPTPSPTPTPTPTPTPSPTSTPTPTPSPTPSPTVTPTPTPSPTATPTPSPTPSPTPNAAAQVVISQLYGGAGCTTANCSTFKNDYVELFNRGAVAVSLAGWSVQYAPATGTGLWQVTPLTNFTLAPGQRYLVREAGNANGINSLPAHDASGSIAMSATAGKVALISGVTPLSGACPTGTAVIDLVGYGTSANCSETAPAPAPSTTTALVRKGDGCADTGSNAADFVAAAPSPRNSTSAVQTCAGAQAKTEEPSHFMWRTLPSFDSLLIFDAPGETFAEAPRGILPAGLSAPRPSGGSTRWRRDAWASSPRDTRGVLLRPPGAWP